MQKEIFANKKVFIFKDIESFKYTIYNVKMFIYGSFTVIFMVLSFIIEAIIFLKYNRIPEYTDILVMLIYIVIRTAIFSLITYYYAKLFEFKDIERKMFLMEDFAENGDKYECLSAITGGRLYMIDRYDAFYAENRIAINYDRKNIFLGMCSFIPVIIDIFISGGLHLKAEEVPKYLNASKKLTFVVIMILAIICILFNMLLDPKYYNMIG